MSQITCEQYSKFCTEFYLSPYKQTLRFGQAFCNKFDVTDSDLFHEHSLIKSRAIIFEKYVDPNM
jgi:hypothetical protein